jgi:threonylcarbamoyladenosine tRNA methylthiotransferase MtaB
VSGIAIETFGCRLNAAEGALVADAARAAGANALVIVNTCAVTNEAVAQARQTIRRLKRERPEARIAVTGCAAEIDPAAFAAMPEVDHVVGNREKLSADTWRALAARDLPRVTTGAIHRAGPMDARRIVSSNERTRVFLPVQTGCDHRCTFCIIPMGRGPSRSLPIAAVIDQSRRLVDAGTREIVLTGVDLASYGRDLETPAQLGTLVQRLLAAVPDLPRLRLSTLDPAAVDQALIGAIATEPRLMPHLHWSLQAGHDLTLKRMKRRHRADETATLLTHIRALRPEVVHGADLIAGFPTEDDAMFRATLEHVVACGLTHLHVFPYSARQGTPAARMPAVAAGVIRERAAELRRRGAARLAAHLSRQTGRTIEVLAERGGTAHAADFTAVRLARPVDPGMILAVTVAGHDGRVLQAA